MGDEYYLLNIGCHRGTLISRDSTQEHYASYDLAYQAYLSHRQFYHSIGYQVWYADIVAPDGTKTHLESNPYV